MDADSPASAASGTGPPQGLGLGTFLGVFTPTVLTILGVIMYLRVGWVVGNAGLVGTLTIVALANAITLITSLSLSALSTNMRVGVGGAYYIISRSMGLEIGGALGIPLYLSQTLSLTLYAYGLAESFRIVWPGAPVELLAGIVVIGVVLIAARSTVLALRMQLPIMLLIGLSLVSLFAGVHWGSLKVELSGPWIEGDFWQVFAVFFPAVTGILAGVGLSGDLKDPARSIPRGVLAAVLVGLVVYVAVPLALAHSADAETLRTDPLIWTRVAFAGFLVMPGLWGAILSSAIGSILTAPRTLQALAQDGLLPRALGRTDEETGEPLLALRISGLVALGAVALGDLNLVASVVSMFFLTTYGMLNLACGLEDLVKDVSYRPRIRTPWWLSLLGACGCFVAMFAINPTAFVAAVSIELVIGWTLSRRAMKAAWGDVRTGIWFALARFSMLRLRTARMEPRNWRPHVLVFTADLQRSLGMVRMASRLTLDHGLVTVNTMLVGDLDDHAEAEVLLQRNQQLLAAQGLLAFCEVTSVPDIDSGIVTIAQAHGFGPLASNVVMVGWPGDREGLTHLLVTLRKLVRLEKSTMILRPGSGGPPGPDGDIVVWWKGRESNGDLMLLLARQLTMSEGWGHRRIRLKSIVGSEAEGRELRRTEEAMLEETRIRAEVDIIVRREDDGLPDLLRTHSEGAALVFLGMAVPEAGAEERYADQLARLVAGLPNTILVRNAGPFRGRLV
ncbi:MAG: Na-K-Cl cotransporter [Deltaproteobacteria bacterium]|nr:MAG: Na-K-Cl cotransporter [Deltaproteobacteria bacterium]